MNLIEVFRENGRIYLVFEQLNRTILEELEGRSDNSGIEPLEVWKLIYSRCFNRQRKLFGRY